MKLLLPREIETQAHHILSLIKSDEAGAHMTALFDCHPDVYQEVKDIVLGNLLEKYPQLEVTDPYLFKILTMRKLDFILTGMAGFFHRFPEQPARPKQAMQKKKLNGAV